MASQTIGYADYNNYRGGLYRTRRFLYIDIWKNYNYNRLEAFYKFISNKDKGG